MRKAILPKELVVNTNVSNSAKILYAYVYCETLDKGARELYTSRQRLAEVMDVSKRTISKYMRELENSDYLIEEVTALGQLVLEIKDQ